MNMDSTPFAYFDAIYKFKGFSSFFVIVAHPSAELTEILAHLFHAFSCSFRIHQAYPVIVRVKVCFDQSAYVIYFICLILPPDLFRCCLMPLCSLLSSSPAVSAVIVTMLNRIFKPICFAPVCHACLTPIMMS